MSGILRCLPPFNIQIELESTFKLNSQLLDHQRPFWDRSSPLGHDILTNQEEQLQQRRFRRHHRLRFGCLAQLPVKTFHRIGGVNNAPDLVGIFEILAEQVPVVSPG